MNPTSQPSLTSRPIHQLLSYFSYILQVIIKSLNIIIITIWEPATHLDVQEVAHFERHRVPVHWRIVVDLSIVRHVCADGKRDRFVLCTIKARKTWRPNRAEERKMQTDDVNTQIPMFYILDILEFKIFVYILDRIKQLKLHKIDDIICLSE